MSETDDQRAKRHRQRGLFDAAADLYDATRQGYPPEIVEWVVKTAGVGAGAPVLEVGCGTGQLTRQLVSYAFELTAIDLGPAMITTATEHVAGQAVRFEATSFEDFAAPDASLDLIVSASAFHWVDPEVAWTKSARLLKSGGWLALLATGERYDDPVGSALMDLWIKMSADGGAWATAARPTLAETIAETNLFRPAVERGHTEHRTVAADTAFALEHTRATTLSYDAESSAVFANELRALLADHAEVGLEQRTSATMVQTSS